MTRHLSAQPQCEFGTSGMRDAHDRLHPIAHLIEFTGIDRAIWSERGDAEQ